jgi:hypothetical protein
LNTDTIDLLKIIQKLQLFAILFHKIDMKINLNKLLDSYYDIYLQLNFNDEKIFLDLILLASEMKMKLCERILINSKFLSNNYQTSQKSINTNCNIIISSFENILKVTLQKYQFLLKSSFYSVLRPTTSNHFH